MNNKSRAELIVRQERMFWEIRNATSAIFVLGTIGIADDTFYPLEDGVLEAFENAGLLITDMGAEEIKELPYAIKTEILKSIIKSADKNILKNLSEEEAGVLYKFCGKENTEALSIFNGWVLKTMLLESLNESSGILEGKKGINIFFLKKAGERFTESLISVKEKLQEITFGSWEEQLLLLKNKIKAASQITKQNGKIQEFNEIKKLYLSDEREKLYYYLMKYNIEEAFDGIEESKIQEYINLTVTMRNKKLAEKFKQCLQQEGITFVFADIIHFCGEESVFKLLEKEGVLFKKNKKDSDSDNANNDE